MHTKTPYKDKPCIVQNNKSPKLIEALGTLWREVPSDYKWKKYDIRHLEARKWLSMHLRGT